MKLIESDTLKSLNVCALCHKVPYILPDFPVPIHLLKACRSQNVGSEPDTHTHIANPSGAEGDFAEACGDCKGDFPVTNWKKMRQIEWTLYRVLVSIYTYIYIYIYAYIYIFLFLPLG